ncbi:hypothetical protein H257_02988 [Aphanomyces astaci]|uniref:AB hydrolase-1 domain-containing protein n=1 Tax=Aphanomyces astaci TaxID=112090 RepID=W4H1W3_APHAT|nr:hypothetical protein H257_02988 [Aphanomyces astaci]ETV85143.1 hypothetical protein H257_02988 [Aphanomyces astaci]|eukprot:XP_009825161.1 hypothetical protein H257_02988 [Aphanomyces astaci]
MPPRVLIVPGNGCTPIEQCNWYAWLANELRERGCEVVLTSMPDPHRARESIWLPFIRDVMKCDRDTVVVGHSSGAEAAMRLAESTEFLGMLLVSACVTDLGSTPSTAFCLSPKAFLRRRQRAGFRVLQSSVEIRENEGQCKVDRPVWGARCVEHGQVMVTTHERWTDDRFIPASEQEQVADGLNSEFHFIDGKDHYMTEDEPLILDVLVDKLHL